MTIEISIKKYKMFILQQEYIAISKLLFNLQSHLNKLYTNNVISLSNKNLYTNKIYEIIKKTNNQYNEYVNNDCGSDSDDSYGDKSDSEEMNGEESNSNIIPEAKSKASNNVLKIEKDSLIKLSDTYVKNEEIFAKIKSFVDLSRMINIVPDLDVDKLLFSDSINNPLKSTKKSILQLAKNIGFPSIITALQFLIGSDYFRFFSDENNSKLQLFNDLFVINSFQTRKGKGKDGMGKGELNENKIFFRKLKNNKDEILERLVELYIENPLSDSNTYLVYKGYIINDSVNILIRTSQISNKYIYNKKKRIEALLENPKSCAEYINPMSKKFRKLYLKHISLFELIIYSEEEFIQLLQENYKKYINLTNRNPMNLMKDFIHKKNTITNMYNTIRLLLLGNSDSINVAGLLFGLTKEKKISGTTISDIIYNNLNYNLQTKLKQINVNIKSELEKIRSLSLDDIDYKKQVLSMNSMPTKVKAMALEKIDEMKSGNNDYHKQLLFVKSLLRFPWPTDNDNLYFEELNQNKDHQIAFMDKVYQDLSGLSYGHKEAKETIKQLIGKWVSNPSSSGSAISFVGPPGVGKTLLAKSIGEAMDLPFAQITLGGQNDGELLHGHGYTYSGAQPGLIIKKMIDTGKSRCILYFDELDKACSKHGHTNEISSILIHLTDPNMNRSFQDRFFQGIDFPLDKVVMIFSYNDSSLIDPILLDRLNEIQVKPYTTYDKIQIVNQYILPETSKTVGFGEEYQIKISDENIKFIIEKYTTEAGVRDLKRKIENIYLQLNIDKIYQRGLFENGNKQIQISQETIVAFLDKPVSYKKKIHDTSEIGIVNGLYATSIGTGGIVPIQIYTNYTVTDNQFTFKLTGSQGDVMKESVFCAYTAALDYINHNLAKFNITNLQQYTRENYPNGFHIHAPSASTPKDGPSAGCAFATAFVSRVVKLPIKNNVAMTGEIDLRGRVTKIGGLRYKLIGAKNAGVKKVFVSSENEEDVNNIKKDIPDLIDNNLQVILVKTLYDIIDEVLVFSDSVESLPSETESKESTEEEIQPANNSSSTYP